MDTVDAYIANFDAIIQERLTELREVFLKSLPQAEESIRYKMPAYKVGKHHLYFAAYKKHIGFYPVYANSNLEQEIKPFRAKGTKDSLHFLHSQPLPIELITKIILLKSKL